MNSPPNFSLIASTSGLVHGSCCGPLGFAGAAGFAPGGGGGGLGTAALGSAGLGSAVFGSAAWASDAGGAAGFTGSAGFSGCWLSFGSSAIHFPGRTRILKRGALHKDVDSTTSVRQVSTHTPSIFPTA